MRILTPRFRLLASIAANFLIMASMYTTNPSIAYSREDQRRDDEIRDEKWRDERIRDENRRDQERDDRQRDEANQDKKREEQRNDPKVSNADEPKVKPVRNLHPELQIAAPRNPRE